MKAPIDLDVTGELVVQIVAAFARSANPSAVLNRVAQALDSAAEQLGNRPVDVSLVCSVATQVRALATDTRATEERLYLRASGEQAAQEAEPWARGYGYIK